MVRVVLQKVVFGTRPLAETVTRRPYLVLWIMVRFISRPAYVRCLVGAGIRTFCVLGTRSVFLEHVLCSLEHVLCSWNESLYWSRLADWLFCVLGTRSVFLGHVLCSWNESLYWSRRARPTDCRKELIGFQDEKQTNFRPAWFISSQPWRVYWGLVNRGPSNLARLNCFKLITLIVSVR